MACIIICNPLFLLVELIGIEPTAYALRTQFSRFYLHMSIPFILIIQGFALFALLVTLTVSDCFHNCYMTIYMTVFTPEVLILFGFVAVTPPGYFQMNQGISRN